jgi:uncharacterized protein
MPLIVNLRHLETQDIELRGELPVAELELEIHDEMVRAGEALRYEVTAQKMERSILVRGRLELTLHCRCVRCLKPFEHRVALAKWARDVPLEGEEKVVASNDCVDLTPFAREDILLELPQHPLCEANCRGLPKTSLGKAGKASGPKANAQKPSAWAALDKLKF